MKNTTKKTKPTNKLAIEDFISITRLNKMTKAELINSLNSWYITAIEAAEDLDYLRSLLNQIGDAVGDASHVWYDGSHSDEVLIGRLPEVVQRMNAELTELRSLHNDQTEPCPNEEVLGFESDWQKLRRFITSLFSPRSK